MRSGTATEITAYRIPLTQVAYFKYLGRFLSGSDNYWPAVVRNLLRAQQKWALLSRVLGREGADARTLGRIYVVVVQVVLMYGSEMWVMTPHIGRVLGRFHHRVDCSLAAYMVITR